MARFNVGDFVYVPNAYEAIWESTLAPIVDIIHEGDKETYICKVMRNNLAARSDPEYVGLEYKEHQLFPATKEGREECNKHILNYYYDGLCRGCKYEDIAGQIWKCSECEHCIADERTDPTQPKPMRCKFTGIVVSEWFHKSHSIECCKKFLPNMPQHKAAYNSWEQYNDYLVNCEFNKECVHHKNSAWTTCTYEYYMDHKLITIPLSFMYEGRKVNKVKISRRRWIEQNFLLDGKLYCYQLEFEYQKNKRGLPRKEDQPIHIGFPVEPTNLNGDYKEVIIDMEVGKIVGETKARI